MIDLLLTLPAPMVCGLALVGIALVVVSEHEVKVAVLRPWQRSAIYLLAFVSGTISALIILHGSRR